MRGVLRIAVRISPSDKNYGAVYRTNRVVNSYKKKKGNNSQFVVGNSIYKITFKFVLHVSAETCSTNLNYV